MVLSPGAPFVFFSKSFHVLAKVPLCLSIPCFSLCFLIHWLGFGICLPYGTDFSVLIPTCQIGGEWFEFGPKILLPVFSSTGVTMSTQIDNLISHTYDIFQSGPKEIQKLTIMTPQKECVSVGIT